MGSIIRFTHKECGFEFSFYKGVGFRLFAMQCESRKYMRTGEWGEHWKELIERYPEGTATLGKAICYCAKCKKYFQEPRIKFYIPKEGYRHVPKEECDDRVLPYEVYSSYQLLEEETITCSKCKKVAQVMEKHTQIPCPVCGKMRRGRNVGDWD
jgi:hypothetical protein